MSTSDVRRRDFLHLTATGAGAAAVLAFLESCKTRAFNKTLTTGTGADGSVRIRKAWEPGNTSDVNQKAYVEAVRILKDNDTKNAKYKDSFQANPTTTRRNPGRRSPGSTTSRVRTETGTSCPGTACI